MALDWSSCLSVKLHVFNNLYFPLVLYKNDLMLHTNTILVPEAYCVRLSPGLTLAPVGEVDLHPQVWR